MQLAPAPVSAPIPVPRDVQAQLAGAVERGVRETADWLEAHPRGTVEQLTQHVMQRVGDPPTGVALAQDHAASVAAVAARAPGPDATAVHLDSHGLAEPWQPTVDAYVARVGADQARAGLRLLEHARAVTTALTFPVKDAHARERPFRVHADTPLLEGVTHVRGGSFPSGHASTAFAHELVLAKLMPDAAAAARDVAEQVSFSRVHAAAHYLSDIVSGAYIGAAGATFAAARPDASVPDV